MNVIDVSKRLATDQQCLAFLEKLRWPNGVRCVTCGSDKIGTIQRKSRTKNKRTQLYVCLELICKQQFSTTGGTLFHDSHLPLNKWFLAIALIMDAKKGMSAMQLQRHLDVNYRTAWYLAHRIRKAMEETGSPLLSGTVEIDETYIGGKSHGHARKFKNKDVVLGIRQRGGPVRMTQLPNRKEDTLYTAISEHVDKAVEKIMTDDNRAYNFNDTKYRNAEHGTIRHSKKEYVRGDIHTNTVESAFSLFKRGLIGSFHQVSIKHLQKYLNEFFYRLNRREDADLFEQTVSRMAMGKAFPYSKLVEENAFTPFVRP